MPANTVVYCSTFGYSTLIAHELGHFYGLSDIYTSGCTSIMGQADGLNLLRDGRGLRSGEKREEHPFGKLPGVSDLHGALRRKLYK